MDKIGQQINPGDFLMILTSGSGWDSKAVFFSLGVATVITDKMVYIGDPNDKKKTKHEKVIVLTEQQMISWVTKMTEEDDDGNERNEMLAEIYALRDKSILK